MNKFKYFILIIVALVSFLSPVLKTSAEIEYKFLAPLPNPDGTIEPVFKVNNDSFTNYLNMLIKLTIGVAGVLTVIMIVMGGIQYMGSELISNKEQGKSQITNALLGLFITLGAYALLYTINPELLNSDPSRNMTEVIVDIQDNTPQTPKADGTYSDGRRAGDPVGEHNVQLPAFAKLYNNLCTEVGQPSCTSTSKLLIAPLINLNKGCNCNLLITGGTETWLHGANTSHRERSGTVDLSLYKDKERKTKNTALSNYFTGGKEPEERIWYEVKAGGYALYEGDHWHYNPVDRK